MNFMICQFSFNLIPFSYTRDHDFDEVSCSNKFSIFRSFHNVFQWISWIVNFPSIWYHFHTPRMNLVLFITFVMICHNVFQWISWYDLSIFIQFDTVFMSILWKKIKRGPKDNSLNAVAGRHFAVRGIHVYVYILANLWESNERGPKDNPVHAVTWDTCLHVYPYESLRE